MGDLTINKILGSLLAIALVIMGLQTLSHSLFPAGPGGYGHDDHGEELSVNEKLAARYAYFIPVEEGADAGGEEEEEVFDLGLALANADISRGERSFRAKCATCHTIEEGGAHGTGPNLYATVGLDKAGHEGFNYSAALEDMEGSWTWQTLNDWLYNPSGYAPGTSMAFAGLRRDDERANVIAYLASYTPDPPPLPEPQTGDAETDGDAPDAADAAVDVPTGADDPAELTGQVAVQDAVDGVGPNDGDVGEVEIVPGETAEALDEVPGALEDGAPEVAEGVGLSDEAEMPEDDGDSEAEGDDSADGDTVEN